MLVEEVGSYYKCDFCLSTGSFSFFLWISQHCLCLSCDTFHILHCCNFSHFLWQFLSGKKNARPRFHSVSAMTLGIPWLLSVRLKWWTQGHWFPWICQLHIWLPLNFLHFLRPGAKLHWKCHTMLSVSRRGIFCLGNVAKPSRQKIALPSFPNSTRVEQIGKGASKGKTM